ncbi:MAG TPA: hypothetical protein VKF79_07665 [Candidatus Acidoferrum sp.]|nr:hypothetical protein [Candidatus Acidoferrum sp.]
MVAAYGADPTCTRDSGPAINDAIAAVTAPGTTLVFRAGCYLIQTPIVDINTKAGAAASGITYQGLGRVTFQAGPRLAGNIMQFGDEATRIERRYISNIVFSCGAALSCVSAGDASAAAAAVSSSALSSSALSSSSGGVAHPVSQAVSNAAGTSTSWLLGGNTVSSVHSIGTATPFDFPIMVDGSERARFLTGLATTTLAFNIPSGYIWPNEPGNGSTPSPGTVEIWNSPTDTFPFDQIVIHDSNGNTRRGGIMFDSHCDATNLTTCVPLPGTQQQDEFEIGVDRAPDGNHNFFIVSEAPDQQIGFVQGQYQTVSLGTAAAIGGVNNPDGAGIAGETTIVRLNTNGPNPACGLAGAWGNGASCTLDSDSTDTAGMIIINTGTQPGSTGYVELGFSGSFGQHGSVVCTSDLVAINGVFAPHGVSKQISNNGSHLVYQWFIDNNSTSWSPLNAYAYGLTYICIGK